jgi:hypothetical protein
LLRQERSRSLQLLLAEQAPLELLEALHMAYEPLVSSELYDIERTMTGVGGSISEQVTLNEEVAMAQAAKIERAAAAMRQFRDAL